ncbi:hypothetical protein [Streptomyces sp. Inha503]|uniref:hypothetical protein n=1 Tax=Streptomyces sp. Inha503 TaxID=3383314 RepID=UPI0039A1270D
MGKYDGFYTPFQPSGDGKYALKTGKRVKDAPRPPRGAWDGAWNATTNEYFVRYEGDPEIYRLSNRKNGGWNTSSQRSARDAFELMDAAQAAAEPRESETEEQSAEAGPSTWSMDELTQGVGALNYDPASNPNTWSMDELTQGVGEHTYDSAGNSEESFYSAASSFRAVEVVRSKGKARLVESDVPVPPEAPEIHENADEGFYIIDPEHPKESGFYTVTKYPESNKTWVARASQAVSGVWEWGTNNPGKVARLLADFGPNILGGGAGIARIAGNDRAAEILGGFGGAGQAALAGENFLKTAWQFWKKGEINPHELAMGTGTTIASSGPLASLSDTKGAEVWGGAAEFINGVTTCYRAGYHQYEAYRAEAKKQRGRRDVEMGLMEGPQSQGRKGKSWPPHYWAYAAHIWNEGDPQPHRKVGIREVEGGDTVIADTETDPWLKHFADTYVEDMNKVVAQSSSPSHKFSNIVRTSKYPGASSSHADGPEQYSLKDIKKWARTDPGWAAYLENQKKSAKEPADGKKAGSSSRLTHSGRRP